MVLERGLYLKNTVSLKKNYQFRHVYNKGKSIANKLLVMYYMPNYKEFNQLGLSVSKKVGKSVIRSKVTRLIKESYRLKEDEIKMGYDIIFIARS
ncbi:MAG: ribonuclease P protein component, partial [Clostridiales bacterium]|nr:ribonuclease P protein component [Clostridiales bacterium]